MLKRLKHQPVDENMWHISSRDYSKSFSLFLIAKFTIISPRTTKKHNYSLCSLESLLQKLKVQ